VDDCITFVQREIRRSKESGQFYDGVIFDPPAYGRGGPDKKKIWKLDRDLPILLELIPELLSRDPLFVLITCHDEEWTAEGLKKRLFHIFNHHNLPGNFESGEMVIQADQTYSPPGKNLKLGTFVRWSRFSSKL
jgi:23S rRNA (cytosine1962-C5)-methyltransferase